MELIEEDGSVVADIDLIGRVKVLEGILEKKSSLAGRVPLTGLLVGEQLLWKLCESLDREGKKTIVPEERDDAIVISMFFKTKEVGNCHL